MTDLCLMLCLGNLFSAWCLIKARRESGREEEGINTRRVKLTYLQGYPQARGRRAWAFLSADIVSEEKFPWCNFRAEMAFGLLFLICWRLVQRKQLELFPGMCMLYHFLIKDREYSERQGQTERERDRDRGRQNEFDHVSPTVKVFLCHHISLT